MHFATRKAITAEINIALALLKSAAATLQQKGIDQWAIWLDPPAEKIKWVEDGFSNGEFYFILINDQIAGMYRLLTADELYWRPQDVEARYIHSLVVLSEYSGQQIGRRVLEQLIAETREAGIPFFRKTISRKHMERALVLRERRNTSLPNTPVSLFPPASIH